MQIPEEFRCCICLETPETALLLQCPHRICASCIDMGQLDACPVCRAELPAERTADEAFAERAACATLRCDCGLEVPLLEAEGHSCETTRKRKRSECQSPLTGRRPPSAPNRSTFCCPCCEESNLTPQGLLDHFQEAHGDRGPIAEVCPICTAMPWGDPTHVARDFLAHLRLRHRCDYAVLADFEADEESMLRRAMHDSMHTAGFGEALEEDERVLAEILAMSAREAGVDPEDVDLEVDDAEDEDGEQSDDATETSPAGPDGTTPDQEDLFVDEDEMTSDFSSSGDAGDDMRTVGSLMKVPEPAMSHDNSMQPCSLGAFAEVPQAVA